MSIYIAYRDLEQYLFEQTLCGGVPRNNDYRLTTVAKDVYLLTCGDGNYAVAKDKGEQFVNEVMAGTTGEHKGYFPLVRDLNGKKTAAVVEDRVKCVYSDFDDEVLLKMLDSLKAESEKLTDKRSLINYCYPNPSLPEGDFDLKSINHQIYAPDNTPPSVIVPYKRDLKTSVLNVTLGGNLLEIREGQTKTTYNVPSELLPEIKDSVRELCKEPAEAYVEVGNWESYIWFGDDYSRIFTDPDKTLELLKGIATKSIFKEKEEIPDPMNSAVSSNGVINGFMGFPSMLQQAANAQTAPAPSQPEGSNLNEWICPACGEKNNGKFCMNCGKPAQ